MIDGYNVTRPDGKTDALRVVGGAIALGDSATPDEGLTLKSDEMLVLAKYLEATGEPEEAARWRAAAAALEA